MPNLYAHRDFIQVILVGVTGYSTMLTETELVLKVLIAAATLGFIIYKWIKESRK